MDKIFQASDIEACAASIIEAAGSNPKEARTVARNLVLANLTGHDSHGVGMVPRYVDAVLEGGLKPNAHIKVNLDAGALLALDAQRGYGQVAGEEAMAMAITRAQAHGSCIMTLANTHHLARIGHYAEMAVAEGLVSIHFVNVISRPIVAPWGGSDGRYSTNPFCVGIPMAGREPFLLDFATARVAQGKMRVAYNRGETVEPGLLIDEFGRPTQRPGVVVVRQDNGHYGALLPFGEHKGSGLAVACELLGGALSGGGTYHEEASDKRTLLNNMLAILIDPARLGTRGVFETESLAFIDWLKESPPGEGFETVQVAGEPERAARALRERDGIAIDEQTRREILGAARKVSAPLDPAWV